MQSRLGVQSVSWSSVTGLLGTVGGESRCGQ